MPLNGVGRTVEKMCISALESWPYSLSSYDLAGTFPSCPPAHMNLPFTPHATLWNQCQAALQRFVIICSLPSYELQISETQLSTVAYTP